MAIDGHRQAFADIGAERSRQDPAFCRRRLPGAD